LRRRSKRASGAALALAGMATFLGALLAFGQVGLGPMAPGQNTQPPASGDTIFSSETRLVPLNVTVTDKNGHPVTDLPESAFQVFENNIAQPIRVFKHEDVPVSLALVIDSSGSMRSKQQAVAAAAVALVQDSNPQDESFVVDFNDQAYLDVDFTSDVAALRKALNGIKAQGGTAMRDAIRMSIGHLNDKAARDKKAVIVITDGNDNASSIKLDSLVRIAQQDSTLIYAIGLLNDEDRSEAAIAKRALRQLVESTGGLVFYPRDVGEVDGIAHEVAHDIRNQYSIAYTPKNEKLDGTFRAIKVAVKAPGNPMARTRTGYWATPSPKTSGRAETAAK
jgi:Ca-activated chloride channel family protein